MALFYPDSHPRKQEDEAHTPLRGVALFIRNGSRLLTVKEKTGKALTGKRRGEYGVPCETLKTEEEWGDAVIRCIHEELGIPHSLIGMFFKVDPSACFAGKAQFSGVSGQAYELQYVGADEEVFSYRGDGEVEVVGWRTLPELRSRKLRAATEFALRMYSPSGRITDTSALVPASAELLTRSSS